MPSSIFNSEGRALTEQRSALGRQSRFPYLLGTGMMLAILCMVPIVLEIGTRLGFSHISKIESRIAGEYRAARSIQRIPGSPSVLLAGNSLLLEDVDMDLLRRSLPGNLRISRYSIEQTFVLDWMYGLRRLFAEGSRPDLVVLAMGPTHVRPTQIKGEYSAFYLFETGDIPEIASVLRLDHTQTSSLYFARYSLYFAGRNNFRNFVLNKTYRPYGDLLHSLVDRPAAKLDSERVTEAAAQRLGFIRETCEAYGARFVFLIPPGFFAGEEAAVLAGARAAGVRVLVPVHNGDFPVSFFRDGFHLNEHGAGIFTARLVTELSPLISF